MLNGSESFIQAFEAKLNEVVKIRCNQLTGNCTLGKISVFGVIDPHEPKILDYLCERNCSDACPMGAEEINATIHTFIIELADQYDMDVEHK